MNSAMYNNTDKSHKDSWMKDANHKRSKVMVRKEHKEFSEIPVTFC